MMHDGRFSIPFVTLPFSVLLQRASFAVSAAAGHFCDSALLGFYLIVVLGCSPFPHPFSCKQFLCDLFMRQGPHARPEAPCRRPRIALLNRITVAAQNTGLLEHASWVRKGYLLGS